MTMIAQRPRSDMRTFITAADFDRLQRMIDSPRYRTSHAILLTSLKEELDRGTIVGPDRIPKRIVTMHSQVRVRDLKADLTETYTLVYPENADIDNGKLSVLAPLGTALLGKKIGQVVKFDAPAGPRRLKVEKILYQPEAAGDFHL